MDLFENEKQEVIFPPVQHSDFPEFSSKWIPPFEEGVSTRTGKNIDKGSDIVKKASSFTLSCLGLISLGIFLPSIVRILYGISRWLYDMAEKVFPQ